MKKQNFVLYGGIITALVLGLLIGYLAMPQKIVEVTKTNTIKEVCQPVKCEPAKTVVFETAKCEGKATFKYKKPTTKLEKEALEKALNQTVYSLKSTRSCENFLKNSNYKNQIFVDYADVEDGCQLFYVKK